MTNDSTGDQSTGDQSNMAQAGDDQPPARRWVKWLMLAGLILFAGLLWWLSSDYIDLKFLSRKEAELRSLQAEYPALVYGVAFTLYVLVTGLSLPGAAVLSLLFAWYFGFVRGVVLVSFASTLGATIAFLLSRHFFQDAVQRRFGNRLGAFNEHLQRDGALYLFWLRLVPLFPFFMINLVMGLTNISTRTFWWVSQVGMLPGTTVYVYAGSRVPSLGELAESGISSVLSPWQVAQLMLAFGLLGAFPLVLKRFLGQHASAGPENQPD